MPRRARHDHNAPQSLPPGQRRSRARTADAVAVRPSSVVKLSARWEGVWRWLTDHGLLVTVVISLITRLWHWWNVSRNDPFYALTFPETDMHTYWEWAKSIVQGDWLSRKQGVFYYGPLYPYFLAMLFRVFGISYHAVHGTQAVLGILAPVALWDAARRLFGRSEALLAGVCAALCAPILFYEQLLLMEGLLVAIHAGIVWGLVRGQLEPSRAWRFAALTGVLSGLACLGRGNFLLVAFLLVPAWWCAGGLSAAAHGDGAVPSSAERERPAWAAWRAAAAFLAGFAGLLLVSLLRNRFVGGEWVLTTGNGPILLYIGNASDSFGIFHYPDSFQALRERYGGDQSLVPWTRELLANLANNPTAFLRTLGRKAWMFFNGYDIADNTSYYLNQRFSWILRVSPVTWESVVALGIVGAWRMRRAWRSQFLLHVYAWGFALSIIAVFVVGRYRLEFLLPMCLWAAAAVVAVMRDIGRGAWKSATASLVGATLLMAAAQPRWSPAARLNGPPNLQDVRLVRPNDYTLAVRALRAAGRSEEAFALLAESAGNHPWHAGCARGFAAELRKRGRPVEAAEILRRYLAFFGDDLDAAAEFALALGEAGRTDDALRIVNRILSIQPKHPGALAVLQALEKTEPANKSLTPSSQSP